MDNIKEIINIGVDLSWEIVNDVELVITTPKYLGYQLAKLQRQDNGIGLWRATRTRHDRFVFEWIKLFDHTPQPKPFGMELPPFEAKPQSSKTRTLSTAARSDRAERRARRINVVGVRWA